MYPAVALYPPPVRRLPGAPASYLQAFILVQIACQLALLFPALGPFRVIFRIASFGGSLALLALLPGTRLRYPAMPAALAVLGLLLVGLLHPTTNTIAAAGGQIMLNLAILAPVFWVTRIALDLKVLRRLLLTLWLFHSASAFMGVVQTYFPGRFQPNLTTVFSGREMDYLESLMITTSSGERVYRPMGLTDVPGGAATGGFFAVLFGIGFFLARTTSARMKAACLGSMILGLMAILMSQVRSTLVMLGCCLVVIIATLIQRSEGRKLAALAVTLAILTLAGFAGAVAIGGDSVTNRLATLVEESPLEVYRQNRGYFLQGTIEELLPLYPFGAGLGRWGMTHLYFGDDSDTDTAMLWAEIQWTGWLFDGGVPLILAYVAAIGITLYTTWTIIMRSDKRRQGDLWLWGTVVLAYSCGAAAVTFNYPIFIGQGGLEFWLLNTALYTVYRNSRRPKSPTLVQM